MRKIVDTGGDNLVTGLKNLIHDVRHNHMMPSMVDATPFKVSRDHRHLASQVVLRHGCSSCCSFHHDAPGACTAAGHVAASGQQVLRH
ncbi:MAG: hypothetical protein IPG77_16290 [Betaproteobacteria bacterium]|nr:hypothetical protein [Betaproteobacteria bacterium]